MVRRTCRNPLLYKHLLRLQACIAESDPELSVVPTGLYHKAQQCAPRATLGLCPHIFSTLKGLQRILTAIPQSLARILVHTVFSTKVRLTTVKEKTDATPFRVDSHTRHTPRVARGALAGLSDRILSGQSQGWAVWRLIGNCGARSHNLTMLAAAML